MNVGLGEDAGCYLVWGCATGPHFLARSVLAASTFQKGKFRFNPKSEFENALNDKARADCYFFYQNPFVTSYISFFLSLHIKALHVGWKIMTPWEKS